MKIGLLKTLNYLIFMSISVTFFGCSNEVPNPLPKCTDPEVVKQLDSLLDSSSIYGSDAKINEKLIILVGVNEETSMKTCKVRVDYSIKNENNNSIVDMVNNIPFVSDMTKNKEVNYSISYSNDKKDYIVEIID